jgi:histidyl-tRNA synthetase
MAKSAKPRRPKAETPKGFRDRWGAGLEARERMLGAITGVYRAWGFEPLETSAVETVEALGKFLPDLDRPNEGVFAWEDEDAGWLALRYDLTAPLARFAAQRRLELPTPFRRYAVGPVWRNEKPGPGRFRQFHQCDADTVGAPPPAADAEMAMMLAEALEAAGIARGDYVVRVNDRKLLDGVLEFIGFHDQDGAPPPDPNFMSRQAVLRSIDKLDRLGVEGVRQLLGPGRKDESGDRTSGVGLSAGQIDAVIAVLECGRGTAAETCANLRALVGATPSGAEGVAELEAIAELVEKLGYGDRVTLDPSVVRGLGYYTGPVLEAELTFETPDEQGRPRRFGSVAGGGRYDDLVKRFTGQAVPATGVSVGVDRLLAALEARGAAAEAEGPVLVCVMDRGRVAEALAMAAELRAGGLRAEAFMGGGNLGKQLKYADKRACPVAVIEGEDEAARGAVQLKDLALGARLAAEIETRAEWAAQPAQVEAPRARLVEAAREMLARRE